jgi:hypothetical protein
VFWKKLKTPRVTQQIAKDIATAIARETIEKTEAWWIANVEVVFALIFDRLYPDFKVLPEEARAIAKHVSHLRLNYRSDIVDHNRRSEAYRRALEHGMHIQNMSGVKLDYAADKTFLDIFPLGSVDPFDQPVHSSQLYALLRSAKQNHYFD